MLKKIFGKAAGKAMSQNPATREMLRGLGRINMHGAQPLSTEETQKMKGSVAAYYDNVAGRARRCWNWGLYDERLDRQLRERIPDYDQYGSDGFSEQLYYFVLQRLGFSSCEGLKILEVGCGSGEGLNFLARLEPRATFIGMDLSQAAVDQANARLSRAGALTFVQGDAENLPFGDGEFDAVLNVESAHYYPNLGRFFAEVKRVLKPGGHFSFVDCLSNERLTILEGCKHASGLHWANSEDISSFVRASIRKRMEPQSLVRTNVRRTVGFPKRFLAERMAMFVHGAAFVDENFSVTGDIIRMRMPSIFRTYHHALAVKAG